MFDNKLIYDVGMHNGDDTIGYLKRGYKVVAIEADPVQANSAREKFKEYINTGQLSILNVGVAAEEGEFDFYINEVRAEWNSFDLTIASRDGLPWHTIKVKALPFSKIIAENGVPFYLKVDIEGHDYLCIRGLDKNDLPHYMSVEVNDISLINDLAEKGFTRFKLIFQYNLAHLELPPNKYFKKWLWGYKLSQWNSFPIKVFRKLGGSEFITWIDKQAVPAYSKQYKKGTSGNFGDQLGGKWHTIEEIKEIYNYYFELFHQLPDKKDYGFWVDVHASW
jgi:FkbM family methyltransferase